MPERSCDLWIGTSFKMTKTIGEARDFARGLVERLGTQGVPGVRSFVIPSSTAIAAVAEVLGPDSPVLVGAQNAHWEDEGAWTGEISVPQAADAGARIIELGHSERREHFGETDATVAAKVRATLAHGLAPLVCVGESDDVQRAGRSAEHVLDQARSALDGLDDAELARVLLAYEPIWAIGERGREATPAELADQFAALDGAFGGRVAGLLYGGSVNTGNAERLLGVPGVTGLFVGRAAWGLDGFCKLLAIGRDRAARAV